MSNFKPSYSFWANLTFELSLKVCLCSGMYRYLVLSEAVECGWFEASYSESRIDFLQSWLIRTLSTTRLTEAELRPNLVNCCQQIGFMI